MNHCYTVKLNGGNILHEAHTSFFFETVLFLQFSLAESAFLEDERIHPVIVSGHLLW
jgi:hypothetical protein